MCMNYTNLSLAEKQALTHLFNTKRALLNAEKQHAKAVENALEIVKKYGTLEKSGDKAVYSPDSEYITLDTIRLKSDMPELLNTYGKTVKRKASVKVLL